MDSSICDGLCRSVNQADQRTHRDYVNMEHEMDIAVQTSHFRLKENKRRLFGFSLLHHMIITNWLQ